ncbi:MAG: hypothetical protein QOI31_814 [Solirubrobacterales bacterium]|nr:hypothetical protein [Solirubrobacterales bacterium]
MNRSAGRIDGMNLIAILVAAALIAGCGGDDEPEPQLPDEGTLLEYSRAGGIAFSVYELSIDADGTATVSTTNSAEPADAGVFKLSDEEIDELRSILEEVPISSLTDPGESACADCFEYTYAYGGGEVTYDDASPPPDDLEPLGEFLAELPIPDDTANGG